MSNNLYTIGQLVRVTGTFTNVAGAAADPTTIKFKYLTPAAKTSLVYGTDGALVKDSTGVYHVDLTLDKEGKWRYRFEGTGALIAAGEGEFQVANSPFYLEAGTEIS